MTNLVTRIEFGSHLYGTSTPESDHDYKSVYIPTAEDILLQRVKGSTGHKVTRFEGDKNTKEDTDDESYSLQRYLSLLAEGQTVAIDMLFAPKPLVTTPLWDEIRANKDRLLTKKSVAFVGYCRTQANKYGIKGSRVAAAKAASEFFKKAVTLLGTTAKVRDTYPEVLASDNPEHIKIVTLDTTPGCTETFVDCCNRKVGFTNTAKAAYDVYSRIYENYGNRARLAETNEGVDWKALSHAIRVAWEAIDLLQTGKIVFPLADAEHILAVKRGVIPYDKVAEEIEDLLVATEQAAAKSTLRDEPDYEWIDALVAREYLKAVIGSLDMTASW